MDHEDVLRAASMYYLQDMKMEVIARHLGTSRSTVSRLIKKAQVQRDRRDPPAPGAHQGARA